MVSADILVHQQDCIKVCKDAETGDYGALAVDHWLDINKSKQQLRFQYEVFDILI